MKLLKVALSIVAIALFVVACANTETTSNEAVNNNSAVNDANVKETAATPIDDIAAGKKSYEMSCARCHKEDGTGGPVEIEGKKLKPEDLTSEKMAKEPDSEYLEYIRDGIPDEGMPAFKDVLTDTQMNQVVKYIRKELQKK